MKDKADYISVLVVSARSSVRRGIVGALFGEDNIKVLGQASNRLELLEGIWKLRPSIVIVDDDDRDISSLETITLINQKSADTKILLLMKDYDEYKELEALRMGVRGFLPRSAGRADFLKCIRALDKGEMW
jgi:Response regulator containing a CheY-like receiver domain and an HTH DNA-binding domain